MIIDSGIATGSFTVSGSLNVSGSTNISGNTTITGSVNVLGGVTGSFAGTVTQALTASSVNLLTQNVDIQYTAPTTSSITLNVNSSQSFAIGRFYGNYDGTSNIVVRNLNSGISASSNVIVASDNGSSRTVYYADFGINSSGHGDAFVGTANDAYLINAGKNLYLGTLSAGLGNPTNVYIFGQDNWQNPQIAVLSTNQVGFNTDTITAGFTYEFSGSAKFNQDVTVNGTLTATTIHTLYETASIIYSSGSNQFGDASNDTQTLYGTVDIKNGPVLVTGSVNASNGFIGNLTGNATTATSASYALNATTAQTASYVSNAQTASYVLNAVSASYAGQADNATNAISASYASIATTANTASYVLSAVSASYAVQADTAISAPYYVLTASYNQDSASFSTRITNQELFSSSLDATFATQAEVTASINALSSSLAIPIANLEVTASTLTAASASFAVVSSSFATTSGSLSTRVTDLESFSSSLDATFATQAEVTASINALSSSLAIPIANLESTASTLTNASASFAADSGSNSTRLTNLENFSSSLDATYATDAQVTASINALSSSLATPIATLTDASASFAADSGSNSTRLTNLENFSSSLDTIYATDAQVTASINALSSSLAIPIDTLTNASASFASSINILEGVTGSYATTGSNQFNGNQSISGSLTVSQSVTAPVINSPLLQNGSQYIIQDTNTQITAIQNGAQTWGFYPGGQFYPAGPIAGASFGSNELALTANAPAQLKGTLYGAQIIVSNDQSGKYAWSFDGVTGNLTAPTASSFIGTASYAVTAVSAPYYVTTASYNSDSSSLSTRTTNLEATASTLTNASASFAVVSGSFSSTSGSLSNRTTNLESTASTLTTASSSFSTRVSLIEGQYATTGSNTFTGTQYTSNTTNATTFTSTAALYTDGGLRVTKDAYVSGGLYVAGNFTVYGTSSINYVTTSVLVGLEYINLNTDLPALRYAGINVGDSGSAAGISSSFWYDSEKDNWLYVHAHAGSTQTSSLAINGPIAYDNLGNEQGLIANYITKGQLVTPDNNHHITSSQIYDDGTTVAIAGNLQVTGSLYANNLTGSLNGSNLVAQSVANAKLQNSAITIAGNSTSLGGSITAATILSSTGVWSGSAQIPNASISNAQLANSTISGIALGSNLAALTIGTGLSGTSYNGSGAVTITNTGVTSFNTRTGGVTLAATDVSGLGAGIFSGSAQIPNASISNAQLANSAVTVNGSSVSLGGSTTITATATNALTIGTGLSGTSYNGSGAVTIANTGVLSITTNTGLSTNASATGNVTITNTGVTSNVAGTGISVSGATGAVTITNSDRGSSQNIFKNVAVSGQSTVVADSNDDTLTFANGTAITITTDAVTDTVTITNAGVTSLIAGTGVSVSGATGAITASIGQAVATSSNVQFNSLGVGTAGSAVAGEIRATADITAYYSSDERLKKNITAIENPIEKLMAITGVTFDWKEGFEEVHSHTGADTGVVAQEIEAINLPGTVTTRETGYKAVKYEKLNALLIEGFKVQQAEINELKALVNQLLNK